MPFQFTFRLFDTDVVVEADDPAVTALFARAYARFRIPKPHPDAVHYSVRSSGELVLDSQVHRVEAPDPSTGSGQALLADYAYTRILNDALGRVRSHILIHAAALSHDGRGLLVAGPSGYGKTTLALALIRRGFGFLSDDIAALSYTDGRLHPCPRALNVRNGAGLTDIESLGGALAEPCPARVLVELSDGRSQPRTGWLWATVDRAPQGLLAELRGFGSVEEVTAQQVGRFVEVVLRTDGGVKMEAALEEACRERSVLLFDVRRRPAHAPDFDRAPQLTPLAPHEVTLALMRHLRGGPRSALIEELGGPARAFLALAEVAAGMQGYRLQVGRLEEMMEAVCDVAEPESPNCSTSTPKLRSG